MNSTDMKQKVYLVYVLIQYSVESVTDAHRVFSSLDKATDAMAVEIEDARENFNIEHGSFLHHTDRCQEWIDEDGCQGYTIGIEELEVD